jgi:autotransporter-associated beta strand protein
VVNEGDLNLGASNVIPDGASKGNLVLDGSNARFLMTPQTAGTAFSETINGLNGRGTVLSNATSGTSTLTVGSGDSNGNFSGTLINGGVAALALTKTGAGTQTLSGANTYTGATNVNGGKLVVNGSISTSTLTTVAASATLEGNGTVGKTIINGTLSVGNSPGTMTFTDTLGLNGATIMEIDGTSGAGVTGGHDFVNLTGSGAAGVLTTGGTMTLAMGVIFGVGTYSWDLFNMASETGTFTSISLADQYSGSLINTSGVWDLTSGDNTWQFTESTGVLGLTVIPEPRAALLGGLGLLALLRRRR